MSVHGAKEAEMKGRVENAVGVQGETKGRNAGSKPVSHKEKY